MEKKRSIGVTILGIYFIIIGSIALFAVPLRFIFARLSLNHPQQPFWSIPYSLGISALSLILGIGILRLREWLRKGAIYYLIARPFISILLMPFTMKSIEMQLLLNQNEADKFYKMVFIIHLVIGVVFSITLSALLVYFLTRPRVKGQFK